MSLIPQRFIDDLLDKVDIVDVVGSRISLRKSGKNYSARCPFHDEKTPSFTVSPDKQFYYCFGCGAGGNAIGFVMDYDRTEFPQAVEQLAKHCGLEVPRETSRSDPADSRRKQLYSVLEEAEKYYRTQLRVHPDSMLAVDYLKTRGLNGTIAGTFGIGFAPPGWDNLITHLGHDDSRVALLLEAGLVIRKDDGGNRVYDRFRQRIMFPIRDTRGRTIGFGGRVLGDDKPKYLNSPETPVFHKGSELYGLYEAHTQLREIPNLVVVEGYMDVVALAQHGIHNAVATLGTAATDEHLAKLFRYTSEVVFCFDGDNAGRKAARRALETCLPAMTDGRSARFLFLPEGEDPDTLVRKLGSEGFSKLLTCAQPLSEFLFTALQEGLNLDSVDGKARLSKLSAPLINRIPAGVYRQLMLKQLAQRTDMDVDTLSAIISLPQATRDVPQESGDDGDDTFAPPPDDYEDYAGRYETDSDSYPDYSGTASPPHRQQAVVKTKTLKLSPVERLVLLLLHSPTLCHELTILSDLANLDDPDTELLIKLTALLRENPDYTLNHVLGYWRGIHGAEQGEKLARIAASDLVRPPENTERDNLAELADICRHLQKRIRKERPARAQLDALLAQEVLSTDDRKRLIELWHKELTAEDLTEEIIMQIKQAVTKTSKPPGK